MTRPEATDRPIFIEPGQPAPRFRLADQHGQRHCLEDLRGRWVALYFYPKDDTPGCTTQACGFRDSDAALRDRGVVVLGVSPDNEASHRRFAEKFALSFPLLADPGAQVAQTYGVWQEKTMFGRTFMGIVRTTYLIDPQGVVARRWDRVKPEGHAEAVLAAVDEASAG